MEVGKVVAYLEAYFPLSLQEGWDNSGLQISPREDSIKGILLSLDVNLSTVDEAEKLNCNLIISHHPLIFSSTKKIYNSFYPYNVIYKSIAAGIGIYSFHTNLDIAKNGLGDYLCRVLGLRDVYTLNGYQFVRVGLLDERFSLEEFVDYVKRRLSVSFIKYVKANNKPIVKVAVCPGSCMDMLLDIKDQDFDVFLSGDLKHHIAVFAMESGINVVDATHYHTEKYSKFILMELLNKEFKGLNIYVSESDYLPWEYK